MSSKTKQSRVVRDLIRIGVFSALWIVVSFLLAFSIAFLPLVLLVLPCVLGVFAGVIYVAMLSKLEIPGGIFVSSALLGLCLFTMAPYGMMFFCTVAGGIVGELLYNLIGKRTLKATMVGGSCAMLGLAIGEYLPFIYMQDNYRLMLEDKTEELMSITEWCMRITTVPTMILLCVVTILLTCLGCLWGKKIVDKHFSKTAK